MKITYYGHSCFLLQIEEYKILFDPFISYNELAKDKVDISSIDPDFMFISHGHMDHVADAESIAKRTDAKVISNFEVCGWLEKKGVGNLHAMNHGGAVKLPFGLVKYVNAVHSSSMPDGSYGGNPGGFIIQGDTETFYYAGDTALTMDMQLYGRYFDIDHAILPIGDNFTMGVDDAIVAAEFIKCKNIIGMHYNTFPQIKIDSEDAKARFESAGLSLTLMEIGQTQEL